MAADAIAAPPSGGGRTGRLFGTDGVRGRVGEILTPELALALGRAAVAVTGAVAPRVLIVRDTRASGPALEAALAAGVAAGGGEALLGGVLPTPAAAVLARSYGLDLAAVVSASHNPWEDNGIKFFRGDGVKLADGDEERMEELVTAKEASGGGAEGTVLTLRGGAADYLRALELRFEALDLTGRRVLLDCANGATYRVAPELFRRLGAEVETLGAAPDGRNINAGCGSTHVDRLADRTAAGGFDAGFAFDGDGDRVLAADRKGDVVDGDELIALAALHLRARGRLPGDGVAVTVMTNYGFHRAMEAAGIAVATTPVGDRHVLSELLARGWALGGEQSGHIIDTGFVPAGDGIASALLTLEALGVGDLADRDAMEKLPQRLVNVEVRDRDVLRGAAALDGEIERARTELEGRGRVLVRPSGTEPLVRVMVEAPDERECSEIAERLASAVREAAA